MYILGISCFYHDSAAALIKDGEVIAAAQEERFTRIKQDGAFPLGSIRYCLGEAGVTIEDIDLLACVPFGPHHFTRHGIRKIIRKTLGYKGAILFPKHSEAHASSAFFLSPYQDAAILTISGAGEGIAANVGAGTAGLLSVKPLIKFPNSLGLFYSAFTQYMGFKVNSGEYKVMGLAPYGRPIYGDLILRKLMDLKDDGSFTLKTKYFNYRNGSISTSRLFHNLLGRGPREEGSDITREITDLASSIQKVTGEVMVRMARHAHTVTGKKNLVLAGGVALNCVGNGRIIRETPYKDMWVQPASGEAGAALGSALYIWYQALKNQRKPDGINDFQKGSLLGPRYSNSAIETLLKARSSPFVRMNDDEIAEKTAEMIAGGKVVGWFQGRMEFGPRALGARSIVADARNGSMQAVMNQEVKFREPFRPFAPSVLEEKAADYFELDVKSPYMLLAAPVKKDKRSMIPAVTHVDDSARVQTVNNRYNAPYYKMMKKFYEKTGCAVIINTSFNSGEEPIAESPQDALNCFMRTKLDCLAIGNCFLDKEGRGS